MATLTPSLTLTSTDVTSDTLSFTVEDTLTIGHPLIGMSKTAVAVSGGTASMLVPSGSGNQYVYIKHTGFQTDGTTATTNQLTIELGGTVDLLRLSAGEFCFFTSKSSSTVEALSSSSQTILVEYAYWTQA
tara:strand:+ start:172 stop:564 length:393 start_codon:yes stop_codon:yes gene_type:complete